MCFDEVLLGQDHSGSVEGAVPEARIKELHIVGFTRLGYSIDPLDCRAEMTCHLLVVET